MVHNESRDDPASPVRPNFGSTADEDAPFHDHPHLDPDSDFEDIPPDKKVSGPASTGVRSGRDARHGLGADQPADLDQGNDDHDHGTDHDRRTSPGPSSGTAGTPAPEGSPADASDDPDAVRPEHGFAPGEEPPGLPRQEQAAHPRHAPDFEQPVYSEQQLAPVNVAVPSPAVGATPAPRRASEERLPMSLRVVGGVLAALIAGQGVARFGEMVLQGVGALAGSVPPLVGVLGFVLFALPVAACAVLASRGTRYALIVGGVLALVVAVLGRIGGVDLFSILSR